MKKSVLWRSVLVLALCIAGTANGMAQDLKSILSGVANAVANKVTGESASLTGTWAYVGPDCKFESDNLLAKAGGEVAAKQVEDKMSGVLEKLGFKEGTTYTFNADSTYTSVVGGKTVNGTYSGYQGTDNENSSGIESECDGFEGADRRYHEPAVQGRQTDVAGTDYHRSCGKQVIQFGSKYSQFVVEPI